MENLTQVTLVVKAANQKIADHTVECALNWTVKKLKQHLATVYPSKPVSFSSVFVNFVSWITQPYFDCCCIRFTSYSVMHINILNVVC
jgi:hypothetical protein